MFLVLLLLMLAFPLVSLAIAFGGINRRTGPLVPFMAFVGPF